MELEYIAQYRSMSGESRPQILPSGFPQEHGHRWGWMHVATAFPPGWISIRTEANSALSALEYSICLPRSAPFSGR